MGKFQDLTGQEFGRWTVLELDSKTDYGEFIWLCRCECQTIKKVLSRSLKNKKSKSCGCLNKEILSKRMKKHNIYDLTGEYGIGYTDKGEEFYFDLEDYDKIKDYTWYIDDKGYVRINIKNKPLRIHKVIMNNFDSDTIDHIDRNKKNNRKLNLRLATFQENNRNKAKTNRNTSGIVGVSWNEIRNKWDCSITKNYKTIHLGAFLDKNESIKTRLKAELKYFGKFAPQKHLFKQYGIMEEKENDNLSKLP